MSTQNLHGSYHDGPVTAKNGEAEFSLNFRFRFFSHNILKR